MIRNMKYSKGDQSSQMVTQVMVLGRWTASLERNGGGRDGTRSANTSRPRKLTPGLVDGPRALRIFLAVAEGFEPPVGVSRLSLSRRVH